MAKLETQYYDPAELVRLKREEQGILNLEVTYDGTLLWTAESQAKLRQKMEIEGHSENLISSILRSERVGVYQWMIDCIIADGITVWQNPNEKDEMGNDMPIDTSRPEAQELQAKTIEMLFIGEWVNNAEVSPLHVVVGIIREGFRDILLPDSEIGRKWGDLFTQAGDYLMKSVKIEFRK